MTRPEGFVCDGGSVTVNQFYNIGLAKWIGLAEEEKEDAGAGLSGLEEEEAGPLLASCSTVLDFSLPSEPALLP